MCFIKEKVLKNQRQLPAALTPNFRNYLIAPSPLASVPRWIEYYTSAKCAKGTHESSPNYVNWDESIIVSLWPYYRL